MGISGCIGLSTARSVSDTFTTSIDNSSITELAVSTSIGSISIEAHDGDQIEIEGEKHAATEGDLAAVTLDDYIEAGTLHLEVDTDAVDNELFGIQLRPDPSIDLDILIPAGIDIGTISTVTGAIHLTNLGGEPEIEGVTGDIFLDTIDSNVTIEVTTGEAQVQNIEGNVTVDSTTGDVAVTHVTDDVSIETTTGDITVEHIGGDLTASTITGDIDTDGIDGTVDID